MSIEQSIDPRRAFAKVLRRRFVQVFLFIFVVILIAVAPYDRELSLFGQGLGWTIFADFQHQTLFEHGRFGGSDIGLFFQIGCALICFMCALPRGLRPGFLADGLMGRPGRFCFFISVSSLYSGLVLIQGIKFAWGRVRPYAVFDDDLALFTEWYELGFHTIKEGKFAGSFPSGHVASASALVGLLWLWPRVSKSSSTLAWSALALLCFMSWFLMTAGRVIARDHWPTDGIFSAILVFVSYAYFAEILFPGGRWPGAGESFDAVSWRGLAWVFGVSLASIALFWCVREIILHL